MKCGTKSFTNVFAPDDDDDDDETSNIFPMLRHDVTKLVEEVNRLEYMCTSQEHELKTLSDRMCDLGQLKETVKVNFFAIFRQNQGPF